jgi:U3 small nucleolar RNA-associated protein 21
MYRHGDHLHHTDITLTHNCFIQIWDFNAAKLLHTIALESPVVTMEFQRNSDLLAVACDDLGIRVIDIETQRVVREFWGHRNRITDMVSDCLFLFDTIWPATGYSSFFIYSIDFQF